MKTAICVIGRQPALRFAAGELSRYLRLATGQWIPIIRNPDEVARNVFVFTLKVDQPEIVMQAEASACTDGKPKLRLASQQDIANGAVETNDEIRITPTPRGYVFSGPNARSVLFAVYRYLRVLGFRWIRPGVRGEVIPRLASPVRRGIRLRESPSYRYRTICIEGATSYEHVRDLIDWQAKQEMNGYFIQFNYGATFWERWYGHHDNPYRKPEAFGPNRAQQIAEKVIGQIEKRGLRFERVGHGWTCIPLGLSGESWDVWKKKLPKEKQRLLAKVKGKRELLGGIPLNTNLCYSNPAVRETMLSAIVKYAGEHREVTALHVWLGDGANNSCECAACRKARPADFYVDLLNRLDARLGAEKLDTRIVFLIYVDLLWPPVKARLKNPDRFILMFAPITRSYLQSFVDAAKEKGRLGPYVRNNLKFPEGASANIDSLRQWQKLFKGFGFDYDYHMLWTCYSDLNMFTLAQVLHKDIQSLGQIGLDGYNSCQTQRQSFPHNLLMDVMARTLWDKRISFQKIVDQTFKDAYGRDGADVARFFAEMSRLSKPFYGPIYPVRPPPGVKVSGSWKDEKNARHGLRNMKQINANIAMIKSIAKRNRNHSCSAVRWSWKYLECYLALLDRMVPAMEAYLNASPEAVKLFDKVFKFLWKNEKTLHPGLDTYTCIRVMRSRPDEVARYLKDTVRVS